MYSSYPFFEKSLSQENILDLVNNLQLWGIHIGLTGSISSEDIYHHLRGNAITIILNHRNAQNLSKEALECALTASVNTYSWNNMYRVLQQEHADQIDQEIIIGALKPASFRHETAHVSALLAHPNMRNISTSNLGRIMSSVSKYTNPETINLLLAHPNAKGISPSDLSKAINELSNRTNPEIIKLLLAHPNAKDISSSHLNSIIYGLSDDKYPEIINLLLVLSSFHHIDLENLKEVLIEDTEPNNEDLKQLSTINNIEDFKNYLITINHKKIDPQHPEFSDITANNPSTTLSEPHSTFWRDVVIGVIGPILMIGAAALTYCWATMVQQSREEGPGIGF